MAKEVILMSNISGLGTEGDVVQVAEGYARNFLLPKKLAAPVTEANRRQLEKNKVIRGQRLAEKKVATTQLLQQIKETSCSIAAKTSAEGKLFGSVTAADIVASLAEQNIAVEKGQIILKEPIKALGVYKVPVHIQPELETILKVWVVEE